jgi:hypothetical protein
MRWIFRVAEQREEGRQQAAAAMMVQEHLALSEHAKALGKSKKMSSGVTSFLSKAGYSEVVGGSAFPICRLLMNSSKSLADRSSNLNAADKH